MRSGRTVTVERRVVVLALVTAALPLLAGCAADADRPQPVVSTTPTPAERSPSPLPEVRGAKGVAKDVTIDTCDLGVGPAVASGTLVNSSGRSADFAVTIAWLPNNSADPSGWPRPWSPPSRPRAAPSGASRPP